MRQEKIGKQAKITIFGTTNAGKSTLFNTLTKTRAAPVSRKSNMTRRVCFGQMVCKDITITIYDTPGISPTNNMMGKAMVRSSVNLLPQGQVTLVVVDATHFVYSFDMVKHVLRKKNSDQPNTKDDFSHDKTILVINKVDIATVEDIKTIQRVIADVKCPVIPISALRNSNIEVLCSTIYDLISQNIATTLDDHFAINNIIVQTTNSVQIAQSPNTTLREAPKILTNNIKFVDNAANMTWEQIMTFAADMTLEQIYDIIHAEVPYDCHVQTTDITEKSDHSLLIKQTIFVKREAQLGIVLGHKGSLIKRIGTRSRLAIGSTLNKTVHLILIVKIDAHWQDKEAQNIMMNTAKN